MAPFILLLPSQPSPHAPSKAGGTWTLPQRAGRALWGAALLGDEPGYRAEAASPHSARPHRSSFLPSASSLPLVVPGLSWPKGHLGTQAHCALPLRGPCSVPICFRPSDVQYLSVHFHFGDFLKGGWKALTGPKKTNLFSKSRVAVYSHRTSPDQGV